MGVELSPEEPSTLDSLTCRCDPEKIRAVHVYLKQHFLDYVVHDLHTPTRLMQTGFPPVQAEHHVVRLTHEPMILPYYAVLLRDFLDLPVEHITEILKRWKFANLVRANRIAIASKDGASAL